MSIRSSRTVVALALLASVILSGCHGWRPQTSPTAGAQLPNPARVTPMEGSEIVLRNATVSQDSLVGTGERGQRVALPLSQVRRVEARRVDGGRTALLVGGILAAVLGLVALAASNIPPSYGDF